MSNSPTPKKDPPPSKRLCPICDRGFVNSRSVSRHIGAKHPSFKDLAEWKDRIKAATTSPLKKCPHCKVGKSNLYTKHIKICPRRPDLVLRPHQEPSENDEFSADNVQFTERFRSRISRSEYGLQPGTVRNYLTQFKLIVRTEVNLDPNFRAVDWLRDQDSPLFRDLREVGEYMPKDYGNSNAQQLAAAWKLLSDWVMDTIRASKDDAETRLKRKQESLRKFQKKAKMGKFGRQRKVSESDSDPLENNGEDETDPALTEQIRVNYLESQMRTEALRSFQEGDYTCSFIGTRDSDQSERFLALEIYLRSDGLRLDAVRNLSVRDIRTAKRVLSKCPFCDEMVVYRDHKSYCKERETALLNGVLDNFEDTERWRILVRVHKTSSKGKIEHQWSQQFYQMVITWLGEKGFKQNDQPFEKAAEWRILKGILGKIVDRQLMDRTNGKLGLNDFRRLANKKIIDSGVDVEIKLRNIGTSKDTALKWYYGKKQYSHIRAQTLKDGNYDPVAGPSNRPDIAGNAVAGPSTRPDSDSDEVEFVDNPIVEKDHSTSLQAPQAPLACKVCNKPYFLESELKRHEKCHNTMQSAISTDQWDSESLNSSIDEEEREARAEQEKWDREVALGLVSIDLGNGFQVLRPGHVVEEFDHEIASCQEAARKRKDAESDEEEDAAKQPKHKGIGKSSKR